MRGGACSYSRCESRGISSARTSKSSFRFFPVHFRGQYGPGLESRGPPSGAWWGWSGFSSTPARPWHGITPTSARCSPSPDSRAPFPGDGMPGRRDAAAADRRLGDDARRIARARNANRRRARSRAPPRNRSPRNQALHRLWDRAWPGHDHGFRWQNFLGAPANHVGSQGMERLRPVRAEVMIPVPAPRIGTAA